MSDEASLDLDSRPLISAVEGAKVALGSLLKSMEALGKGAAKSFQSLDDDALSSLGTVRTQAAIVADTAARATINLGSELDIRLNFVRQHLQAVQQAYETASIQALAEQKRVSIEELALHKEQGASLLKEDLKRLRDRDAALKLAAQAKLVADKEAATIAAGLEADRLKDEVAFQEQVSATKAAIAAKQIKEAEAYFAAENRALEGLRLDRLRDEVAYQEQVSATRAAVAAKQIKEAEAYFAAENKRIEALRLDRLRDEVEYQATVSQLAKGLQADRLKDEVEYQARSRQLNEGLQADRLRDELAYQANLVKVREAAIATQVAQAKAAQAQMMAIAMRSAGSYTEYNPNTFSVGKTINPIHPEAVSATNSLTSAFKLLKSEGGDVHSMFRGLVTGANATFLAWGNMVPMVMGFAASIAAVKSLKVGAEFEQSLFVIGELAGNSQASVTKLRENLMELGSTTQYGPLQAAKAMETLALAGLDAEQALAAVKPALQFAAAGGVTTEKAAETLVAVSTAYNLVSKDATLTGANIARVGDIIAKTAADSMASVDSMAESFRVSSVVAQQFGVSLEDTAQGLALLAQIGIRGTSAGTAWRNFYSVLGKETGPAATQLKALGLSFKDSNGQMLSFSDTMEKLAITLVNKTGKVQSAIKDMLANERGGKELAAAMGALTNKIKEMNPELQAQADKLEASGQKYKAVELRVQAVKDAMVEMKKAAEESVAAAAGISARAALEASFKPEGQMTGIKGSIDVAFVESLKQSSDAVYLLGVRIREAFNSTEFKRAVSAMLEGAVWLANAFIDLTKWVVESSKGLTALASGLLAAKLAMSAYTSVTVAAAASTVAVGVAAEGAGLMVVAMETAILTAGVSIAAAAVVAAALAAKYWLVGESAQEAAEKERKARIGAATTEAEALTSRMSKRTEAAELELKQQKSIYEALSQGKTLQEGIAKAESDTAMVEMELRAKRLNEIEEEIAKEALLGAELQHNRDLRTASFSADSDYAKRVKEILDTKAIRQQDNAFILRMAKQHYIDLLAETQKYAKKNADMMRDAAKLPPIVGSDTKGTIPDRGEQRDAGRRAAELARKRQDETRYFDEKVQAATKAYTLEEQLAKRFFDNEIAILNNAHSNKLISEGEYQAKLLSKTSEYETKATGIREQATKAAGELYWKRYEQLLKTVSAPELTEALRKLDSDWEAFTSKLAATDATQAEAALRRITIAAQNAQGVIAKLSETSEKFWKQDAIDAKAARAKLSTTLDPYKAAAEQAAATAAAKYDKELVDIAKVMKDTETYANELRKLIDQQQGGATAEQAQELQNLEKLMGDADKLMKKHAEKASAGIAEAASVAMAAKVKEKSDQVTASLADAIYVGLTKGGEEGAKSIRAILEEELMTKPIKMAIQVFVQDIIGGGRSGSGSGILGDALQFANNLGGGSGTFMSQIVSNGQGLAGMTKWLGQSGFGDSFVNAINLVGGKMYDMGAEKIGSFLIDNTARSGSKDVAAQLAGDKLAESTQTFANGLSYINAAIAASEGRWGAAIGQAVGTYFGGPIGGAIGNFVGNLVDNGFGGGREYTTGQGIEGTFSGAGMTGNKYQTWYNPGSWWGHSSNGKNVSGLDPALTKSLGSAFAGLKMQAVSFSAALGGSAQGILDYSKSFSIDSSGGAESVKNAINSLMTQMSNEMAATVISTRFQKEGEALSATLARLAVNLTSVNEIFFLIDKTALSLTESSGGAASALVEAMGGLDSFVTASKSYYDLYYTAAEKQADTTALLAKQFNKMNIVMPTTNAGFRALVEAQDISTEAGRNTYVALMGMSSAFASLTTGATTATTAINVLTGLTEGNFATRVAFERFKGRLLNGESTIGYSGVPGFAAGGQHDGGWRIVGEKGPELEHTGPSSVYNNSRSLFDTTELVAEIQALRSEVANLRIETRAIVSNTAKVAKLEDKWDTDGMPPVRT